MSSVALPLAPAASGTFAIEVVRSTQGLAELSAEWCADHGDAASPLVDLDWFRYAAEHLHANDALHVLVVRQNAVLTAIAPLVARVERGVTRLHILGAATLGEPTGLLYRDEPALSALVDALLSLRMPVVLQRLAQDDRVLNEYARLAVHRGRVFLRVAASAPFVTIDRDWATYLSGLSSRRRYDYRRNRKRLAERGTVEVSHRIVTPEHADASFSRFVAVEGAGWKTVNGSSLRTRPTLHAFFRDLSARWAVRGCLRLSFLSVQGQDVAAVLWLDYAGRAWVLKIGYDERWAEYSPGIQLLWDVLQTAVEQRLSSFEFLGSDEPWLAIWTTAKRPYRTLIYYPRSVTGIWALLTDAAMAVLRRLRPMAGSKAVA